MFFLGAKLAPKQLWEKKNHHHLYNSSLNTYEQANTRIEVFYAVQGKRVEVKDKPRVDSLVQGLRRCLKSLQHNSTQALDPSTRDKLGKRDFQCVLRFAKDVETWLDNVLTLQARLQCQLDAEKYFRQEEDHARKLQAASDENDYLNKPLPPLRKSVVSFTSGLKSRVTIMPAEKDVEVWLMLEDEVLNPIIDAYRRPEMAFERDGFLHSPINKKDWI